MRRREGRPGALLLGLAALAFGGPAGAAPAAPPDYYYQFLSRDLIGASAFTAAHPTWDGRGVVIAVLDTGVDPSAQGLEATPLGAPKVIEARDFTGEGDVPLEAREVAVEGGVSLVRAGDVAIRGVDRLPAAVAPGEKLLVGVFREASLARTAVPDVDGDGHGDGVFAIVAYRRAGDRAPVVVIDTDGDGDVSDEQARRSYADEPAWFAFRRGDPRQNQTPVAFTVTLRLDETPPVAELHFDDGGHGTHCAGIAAGYRIAGREGFDGIAPGAQVMSLKIGHGALAGGATTPGSMKKAIAYASRWAREHGVPVVMSVSYGVGSEREGMSDIDRALDDALADNRLLMASVSAGNEGPGLSSVGTPAAATLAWSSGAVLTEANARALYGARVDGPRIFSFSSRGGELAKPDGVAPGAAWSSVPPFMTRAVMAGTSMAAPQASGAHALLVSAALAEQLPWTPWKVRRAFRATGKALGKGVTEPDQGAGLIQVPAAWDALRGRLRGESQDIAGLRVETPIATRPGSKGSASYWRAGGYLPDKPERVEVVVTPIFYGDATDAARTRSFLDLDLDASAGFIDLDRGTLGIRGANPGTFALSLSRSAAREPGLVSAVVIGKSGGVAAFRLPVTVVVPERFDRERSRSFKGTLAPGDVARRFIEVPPGATAMRATLQVPKAKYGALHLLPFDLDGHAADADPAAASSVTGGTARFELAGDALTPGVWELDVAATFRGLDPSVYQLDVAFYAVELPEEVVYEVPGDGPPRAELTVTNRFDAPFRGKATARVVGAERVRTEKLSGTRPTLDVTIGPEARGVELQLAMAAETYARFTDVAATLVDADGAVVAESAFSTRRLTLAFDGPPGRYRLELVAATVGDGADLGAWDLDVTELSPRRAPIAMAVSWPDAGRLTLLPQVPTPLTLTAAAPFPELPKGSQHRLELTFDSSEGHWFDTHLPMTREQ